MQKKLSKEEGLKKLHEYYKNQSRNIGIAFLFTSESWTFKPTYLLKDYEKLANFPLPPSLELGVIINEKGIRNSITIIEWCDISSTAILTKHVYKRYSPPPPEFYLLVCLSDGKIVNFLLKDITHLYNLTGHFIEQYRLMYEEVNE